MRSRLSRWMLAMVVTGGFAWGGVARSESLAGAVAGKPYTLHITPVSAKKGQPATVTVLFTPAKGYHVNKDFPTKLKLSPPAGVVAAKTELLGKDAKLTEQEGRFEVQLTSSEAGKKSVPGELRFAVCTETTCDPQKATVTIDLTVK